MAFFNKVGATLRQSISASSEMNGHSVMLNAIRCMSSKLFIGARVIIDRDTGRSRGFGFVNYADEQSACSALSAMDGCDLQGRNIRVSYAEERAPRSNYNNGGGGFRGGYGNAGGNDGF